MKFIGNIAKILILILLAVNLSYSQTDYERINKLLPKNIGLNNFGTEFLITVPPPLHEEPTVSNAQIQLIIISYFKTIAHIDFGGNRISRYVVPYEPTIINLSPSDALPYSKNGFTPEVKEFVAYRKAVRVSSNSPIALYVSINYSLTSEGFLALPVSALSNKYIISSYPDASGYYPYYNSLPSLTGIVAAFDNTKVRFTLGGNEYTKTAGGLKPGFYFEETLNKGDVWIISSGADNADLSGSSVESNLPVSVITANQCANVPISTKMCNYLLEQEFPVNTWGNTYLTWSLVGRKHSPIIRIYASQPNTNIYRNGNLIANLPKNNGLLGDGYIEIRSTEDSTNGISIISSDKPIGVSLFNTGSIEDGLPKPKSDPFQINLAPFEQFQNEMTLFSFGFTNQNYSENYLVLIYACDNSGVPFDDFEISRVYDGPLIWRKVKEIRPVLFNATYPMLINGKHYAIRILPWEQTGVYKLRSSTPFSAYIYGTNEFKSYGFNASILLLNKKINDKQPPVPIWEFDCQGNVNGSVVDKPDDPNLRSNLSLIFFFEDESFNYIFESEQFTPEISPQAKWRLRIIDPVKEARAVIRFTDDAGNDTLLIIDYHPPKIEVKPNKISFGLVTQGENIQKNITITNLSKSNVTLNSIKFKNEKSRFIIINNPINTTLTPQQQISITIQFTALKEGYYQDTLVISNECIELSSAIFDANVGSPEILVSDINFGEYTINKTVIDSAYISNVGNSRLIITDYIGPNRPEFKVIFPNNITISKSNPLILEPGSKPFKFFVEFTPTSEADFYDNIIFSSNARKSDSIAFLNGRGVIAGLVSNICDFGRKRIHRDEFPAGPYYIDNMQGGIRLENNSNEPVTITNYSIVSSINGDAFSFNPNIFLNKTVLPNTSLTVPVSFLPKVTGEHELIIVYENTAGYKTQSILKGIGIVPKIEINNITFDTTVINDNLSISYRTLTIKNLGREQWDYCDTLTIFELIAEPDSLISASIEEPLSRPFAYDKNDLLLNQPIPPGTVINVRTAFSAREVGPASCVIYLKSDAQNNPNSKWQGWGTLQEIKIASAELTLCPGQKDYIKTNIENIGSKEIVIKRIYLEPSDSIIQLLNANALQNLKLSAYSKQEITLQFSPEQPINRIYSLIAIIDNRNDSIVQAEIRAIAKFKERYTSIEPISLTMNAGNIYELSIFLEPGDNLTNAAIDRFEVTINYNPKTFEFLKEKLSLGEIIKNRFIIEGSPSVDYQKGIVKFKVRSLSGILDGSGELIKFYVKAYHSNSEEKSLQINHQVEPINSNCARFLSRNCRVSIAPYCQSNLTKLIISNNLYSLSSINPNPVGSEGASISYSVAFDSFVNISIYNTNGELVKTIVNENKASGLYSNFVDVTDIPSGVYICKMISGIYTESQIFVIYK